MNNYLSHNNIQQKHAPAQNVTLPPSRVTGITDASAIMGHHGCLRYYGLNDYATFFFQRPLPLVGRSGTAALLWLLILCSDFLQGSLPLVGLHYPVCLTNGKGTTSRDLSHNQKPLIRQQPLAALIWQQALLAFFTCQIIRSVVLNSKYYMVNRL